MIKVSKTQPKWMPIAVFLCTLVPWLYYLLRLGESPRRDWDYFNSLALVVREQVLSGKLPLFDPWICGGIDLIANPQNWIYSPLLILTIVFPPYLSNLLSLVLCSALGFWGMMKVTSSENILNRSLISALFILSSFFSLHFAEGHLVYRTFFLLPWIIYHAENPRLLRGSFWILTILSLMFLDGGIYPFYFSIFILVIHYPWRRLRIPLAQPESRGSLALMVLGFVSLLGAKALPVLQVHSQRVPESESSIYSIKQIAEALYNPHLTNFSSLGDFPYYAHEYSLYLGLGLTLLGLLGLKHFKEHRWLLVKVVLFVLVAFGVGGDWNPWGLIKALPFVKHLHVQSRVLIIAFLLLLVFVARLKINPKIKTALLLLSFFEFLYVSTFVSKSAFRETTSPPMMKGLETGPVVYQSYIRKPEVYASGQISHSCYEPAKNRIAPDLNVFLGNNAQNLRTEINFSDIHIRGEQAIEPFVMNFAWNGGWDCQGCEVFEKEGLVGVIPSDNQQQIVLKYWPYHIYSSLILLILGVLLLGVSFKRIKHEL